MFGLAWFAVTHAQPKPEPCCRRYRYGSGWVIICTGSYP